MDTVISSRTYFSFIGSKRWFSGTTMHGELGSESEYNITPLVFLANRALLEISQLKDDDQIVSFTNYESAFISVLKGSIDEHKKIAHLSVNGVPYCLKTIKSEGGGNAKVVRRFIRPVKFPSENIKIVQIACGSRHTLFLTSKGEIYGKGLNEKGQLGIDPRNGKELNCPQKIFLENERIKLRYIECFDDTSFALSDKGTLYSWGREQYKFTNIKFNVSGRQEEETKWRYLRKNVFFDGPPDIKVVYFAAGFCTMYAVAESRTRNKNGRIIERKRFVYVWGLCYSGKGRELINEITPKKIKCLEGIDVIQIAPVKRNMSSCYFLTRSGKVLHWDVEDKCNALKTLFGHLANDIVYITSGYGFDGFVTKDGILLVKNVNCHGLEIKNLETVDGVVTPERVAIPIRISIPLAKRDCIYFISNVIAPFTNMMKEKKRLVGKKRKLLQMQRSEYKIEQKDHPLTYLTFDNWVEVFITTFFYHVSFVSRNEMINIIGECWRKGHELYTIAKKTHQK